MTKSSLEKEKVYLTHTHRSKSITEGSWGKEGKQKQAWMGGINTAFHFTDSFTHSQLPIQPRITCPGNGVTHSRLGPPMSVNNRDNPPQIYPQVCFILTTSLNIPSQVTLGHVKLIIKANWTGPECAGNLCMDLQLGITGPSKEAFNLNRQSSMDW